MTSTGVTYNHKNSHFWQLDFTGKERDPETGYSYFGARYLDHTPLTLWLSVDPMADKYPSISPYAYCAWNPLKLVDPDGNEISTHTDKEGNVVAVYNDGDNGVYRHNGNRAFTENELKEKYNPTNHTDAGGEWMGESLHSLSFAEQGEYNSSRIVVPDKTLKIQFGSTELTDAANNIIRQNPSLKTYAQFAGQNGDWDIKKNIHQGSLLYGKYASPRDAGNFVAGVVAESAGTLGCLIAQFGYGAYNISGNNKVKTGIITVSSLGLLIGTPIMGAINVRIIMNGEDELSQHCIDLGKEYQKKHKPIKKQQ